MLTIELYGYHFKSPILYILKPELHCLYVLINSQLCLSLYSQSG